MIEDHARRNRPPALVARQIAPVSIGFEIAIVGKRFRQHGRDGLVEIDLALVGQPQHCIGENDLGQRRAIHNRLRRQRIALCVALAKRLHRYDLAPVDDRDREAARPRRRHRLFRGHGYAGPIRKRLGGRRHRAQQTWQKQSKFGGAHYYLPVFRETNCYTIAIQSASVMVVGAAAAATRRGSPTS